MSFLLRFGAYLGAIALGGAVCYGFGLLISYNGYAAFAVLLVLLAAMMAAPSE